MITTRENENQKPETISDCLWGMVVKEERKKAFNFI